ncbi:MAG: tetratricopeptide repeat protein [Pyrinomonadaceae bacterium]
MKSKSFIIVVVFVLFGLQIVFAQNNLPPVPPKVSTTPKLSETLSRNLEQLQQKTDISRERREQAYAKLLEGQRYIWNLSRPPRSQSTITTNARLAKQSLQKAVELNPTLAEGYTALAEMTWTTSPNDLDEPIMLANIAVKIDPNNFGGHQLLARFYSIKSGLNSGNLDLASVQKAISEWKEVARLDPRNAEAFAFLSEFYGKTNKQNERIEALKSWLASATPLDSRFYRAVIGKQAELSPDSASLKLGEALIESGETREAVEILSRAVADNPDNPQALELLREAIETADNNSVGTAVEALQQAVFANPENTSLMILLAKVQVRTGKKQEALQTVRKMRLRNPDDYGLLRTEASILTDSGKVDEAVALVKTLINRKTLNTDSAAGSSSTAGGQGNGNGAGMAAALSPMNNDFTNYLLISNLYSQAKRGEQAVEAANQAFKIAQNDNQKQNAKLTLATAQQMAGEYAAAEVTLRELLKESPQNPIALNNLGYFLVERDAKLNEALDLIQQAVKIDPTNPSYLDSLGWAYFKLGKLNEAEKYLKDALRFDASSATINEHLGDVHQKQGKPDLAKSLWQKALNLTSDTEETNRLKTKLNTKVLR